MVVCINYCCVSATLTAEPIISISAFHTAVSRLHLLVCYLQEFVSHCAPDDPTDLQPSKMTCQQLRTHLTALNLDTRGNKPQLVARLQAAKTWMAGLADTGPAPAAAAAAAAGGGADSDTEMVVIGDSNESGDELDKAEDALAKRLSGKLFVHPGQGMRVHARGWVGGGVNEAGDELDKAEDALAEQLSGIRLCVPRVQACARAGGGGGESGDELNEAEDALVERLSVTVRVLQSRPNLQLE